MLVTKEFFFDAAHRLKKYNGPCANLHGHTYKLHITVSGSVNKNGMVIDFIILKKIIQDKILSILDHKFINKIIKQPTAENITIWIWKKLKKNLPLYEIKLWETPTSIVTYRGTEYEKETKK